MGNGDWRDAAIMRDVYGLGERGERLDDTGYDLRDYDGPETVCWVCSTELPEPDGECPDPECAEYAREHGR